MGSLDSQNYSREDWAECMEKVKQQDKHAFALVFQYFSPRLKQFVYRHVGNEHVAMEMVQETMATVWQKSALFDGSKARYQRGYLRSPETFALTCYVDKRVERNTSTRKTSGRMIIVRRT